MSLPQRDPSPALAQLAGLVLEDGRRWGEAAHPHQLGDAVAILDTGPDDPPFSFLTRPRGGSKTTDLAGIVLSVLLHQQPPGSTSCGAAADQGQAALLIESIAGFVHRTPGLKGSVKVAGRKVTNVRNGATFEALATDLDSSWGLRPAFLVIDEVAQWPGSERAQAYFAALHSATGKYGARMVLLTSAGDDVHWSRKVLVDALESPEWRVSEMPGPTPWASERWLAEQRRLLPEWQYRRLHLNEWTGADDRLTSPAQLARCVTLDGPLPPVLGVRYVMGLDVGLKNDRTVAVVAHLEQAAAPVAPASPPMRSERVRLLDAMLRQGAIGHEEHRQRVGLAGGVQQMEARPATVVLDRIQVWKGSKLRPVRLEEVEHWLLQTHASFNGAPLVFDPYQAVGLAQRLHAQGVACHEFHFNTRSIGRLASTLHLLLRDEALALPDDPELLEELANVRLRETAPGQVRMDHQPGQHDDRAIALALAATHLLEVPVARPPQVGAYTSTALRGTR